MVYVHYVLDSSKFGPMLVLKLKLVSDTVSSVYVYDMYIFFLVFPFLIDKRADNFALKLYGVFWREERVILKCVRSFLHFQHKNSI